MRAGDASEAMLPRSKEVSASNSGLAFSPISGSKFISDSRIGGCLTRTLARSSPSPRSTVIFFLTLTASMSTSSPSLVP